MSEFVHIQKNVGHSPRKLRLVADMVRSQRPAAALTTLSFTQKAASSDLAKAIQTALSNAKLAGKATSELVFKRLEINEGMKLKRYRVGTAGRGRGRPYRKRMSHIRIVLSDEVKVTDQKVRKSDKPDKKGDGLTKGMTGRPARRIKALAGRSGSKKVAKQSEVSPDLSK